jgi:hypothetical protein
MVVYRSTEGIRVARQSRHHGEAAMTEDHGNGERFSEEEFAFLRHVRFGELPGRVSPQDRVELTETEPRRDLPEPEPAPWYPGT